MATEARQVNVSPARQAWRRLRANRLAMGGLLLVLTMGLAVALVPWLSPHDPTLQRPWLGALPPGAAHPDVLQENIFAVGQPVESGAGVVASSGDLQITVRTTVSEDYRVSFRRGRIARLQRLRGAELLSELALAGQVQEILPGDALSDRRLPTGVLRLRQPPPEGLITDGQRVLLLRISQPQPPTTWRVERAADGQVTAIDGPSVVEPVERLQLGGDEIIAISSDGRPIETSHRFGTDTAGRDVLARVLYGGRISLLVGFVATLVSLLIGVAYGACSGYLGGRWDRLLMYVVDILYGLPFMFLVILLLVHFGRNILVLFAALGAVQWLTMARIIRGQILGLKEREFIAAARLSGSGSLQILGRHLIPNCLGPVIIYTTLTVPVVILEESFLAFIGLQVEWQGQALDSWGALVKYGMDHRGESFDRWWLLMVPALAMCLTLLALNALGSGLRDALDPQGSRSR